MRKISELPSATTISHLDIFPIVQGGVTKSIASLIMLGIVNVKLYGAVGDGVTDDSAAVAAALAVSNAVFFPPGTSNVYLLKDVTVGLNKTIYGCGSVFKPAPGATSIFTSTGFKPAIYDCYFDCANGNLINSLLYNAAVVVVDATYPTVGNVQFVNCDTGLLVKVSTITTTSQTSKGSFFNLKFDTFSARGVLIGPNVNTCTFDGIRCYSGVTIPSNIPKRGAIGFQIYSTGSLGTYGGHMISNVDCEQSEYGFQLTDATLCHFNNCFGDSVARAGFQVTGASTDIKFTDCFAGTCLLGFDIDNTSSVILDSVTTKYNGVVPPWWVGPAAFFETGAAFDITVRSTASVQIGSWFGDHAMYADSTASMTFDTADHLYANTTATIPAGSTNYFGPAGLTALELSWVAPKAGVITNFSAQCGSAPGASQTFVYTVRVNSADTAMVATISGTGSFGATSTVPVAFTAGQNISIKLVTSAGAAAAFHRTVLSLRYF